MGNILIELNKYLLDSEISQQTKFNELLRLKKLCEITLTLIEFEKGDNIGV